MHHIAVDLIVIEIDMTVVIRCFDPEFDEFSLAIDAVGGIEAEL
jgi:hypothetical protein